MPEEGKEIHRQIYYSYNEVSTKGDVAIMQKVARDFGITILVLAKEGEEYRPQVGGKTATYTCTVPKNSLYIMVSCNDGNRFGDFGNAVRAKTEAKQTPVNPPKI